MHSYANETNSTFGFTSERLLANGGHGGVSNNATECNSSFHDERIDQASNGTRQDVTFDYYYDEYFYEGFRFERVIYKYVWLVLAAAIVVSNFTVVLILARKASRSSTNICLIAIAIFETLAILSTLPGYIHTYEQYEKGMGDAADVYILTKSACEVFMFSKFFLSKTLRLTSIWIHCYIDFQRFVSIWTPFRAKLLFTVRRTIAVLGILTVTSPLVHMYQAINSKSENGLCHWKLATGCHRGCVYIWISAMLMNFIPCAFMTIMTSLMIINLVKSSSSLRSSMAESYPDTMATRIQENRRVSKIVAAVVISLLIPEVPYGVFLLVSIIRRQRGLPLLPLYTNRAFHAVYEIAVCASNLSNFWIYFLLNTTFRRSVVKLCGHLRRCHQWRRGGNSRAGTSSITSGASHMTSGNTKSSSGGSHTISRTTSRISRSSSGHVISSTSGGQTYSRCNVSSTEEAEMNIVIGP